MLETAAKYEAAFDRLFTIDSNYRSYLHVDVEKDHEGGTGKRKSNDGAIGAPSATSWERARNFIGYLQNLFDVTTKISGSMYVTSNTLFSELVRMHATIPRMCSSLDEEKWQSR